MAEGARSRQSGLELLRIVSMVLIVAHHMAYYANPPIATYPLDSRWVWSALLVDGGKVGVDVFVLIPLWFYAKDPPMLRTTVGHLARSEAIVLFYSLAIYAATKLLLRMEGLPAHYALMSALPTITRLWWFVTSYCLTMLVAPFLMRGLGGLDKDEHRQLLVVLMLVVGVVQMWPRANLPINAFVVFMYLGVLASYVQWHAPKLVKSAWLPWLLVMGSATANASGSILLKHLNETGALSVDPLRIAMGEGYLFNVCEALGLTLAFSRLRFSSETVNFIARSSFAVYLLSEHPVLRNYLWQTIDFHDIYESGCFVPVSLLAALSVFSICIGVDLPRRGLFRLAALVRRLLTPNKARQSEGS